MDLSKLKARKAEERNCYTDHAHGHKCWEGSCFRRGFGAGWEECEELYRPLLEAVEKIQHECSPRFKRATYCELLGDAQRIVTEALESLREASK